MSLPIFTEDVAIVDIVVIVVEFVIVSVVVVAVSVVSSLSVFEGALSVWVLLSSTS